jgi:hypothetical protein
MRKLASKVIKICDQTVMKKNKSEFVSLTQVKLQVLQLQKIYGIILKSCFKFPTYHTSKLHAQTSFEGN